MRGKPFGFGFAALGSRITPAHAGKTSLIIWRFSICKDHPRACGENGLIPKFNRFIQGSPPRMRGKHENPSKRATATRITPAHAGKTISLFREIQ